MQAASVTVKREQVWIDNVSDAAHLETSGDKLLMTNIWAARFELSVEHKTSVKLPPAAFQTCTDCNKKIKRLFRVASRGTMQVAFVRCSCGYFPVVVCDGQVVKKLAV